MAGTRPWLPVHGVAVQPLGVDCPRSFRRRPDRLACRPGGDPMRSPGRRGGGRGPPDPPRVGRHPHLPHHVMADHHVRPARLGLAVPSLRDRRADPGTRLPFGRVPAPGYTPVDGCPCGQPHEVYDATYQLLAEEAAAPSPSQSCTVGLQVLVVKACVALGASHGVRPRRAC